MTSSEKLVLDGYHLISSGLVQAGDKYWDPIKLVWLPVTVNDRRQVEDFVAVIRKGEEQ